MCVLCGVLRLYIRGTVKQFYDWAEFYDLTTKQYTFCYKANNVSSEVQNDFCVLHASYVPAIFIKKEQKMDYSKRRKHTMASFMSQKKVVLLYFFSFLKGTGSFAFLIQ